MNDASPLITAQQKFVEAVPLRILGNEMCSLSEALGRTLYTDILAPTDMPPYPRAIVEGFVVNTADTDGATEDSPKSFQIVGEIKPGDSECPRIKKGQALRVATGSIVSPDAPFSVVRMWEAQMQGNTFEITRPFPPRFFIEEQGCDLTQNAVALKAGTTLTPFDIGMIASLGIHQVKVSRQPNITIFASGNEVIPFTESISPGKIRDSNSIMLAAAVTEAGGIPDLAGVMKDDFDTFAAAIANALQDADMVIISGGTAVGGRDFIADMIRQTGKLVIDGVPMRSGKPLIMGMAENKPLVCVAGHPPEALRGFRLFGVAAINRLLGKESDLPLDE